LGSDIRINIVVVQQRSAQITVSRPRETVCVTLNTDVVLEGPVGATIEEFLVADRARNPKYYDSELMGGIVDGKLRELSYPVQRDCVLEPVLLSSSDGGRIYRRSLVMLLTVAVDELWPGTKVEVNYAIPDGGFYCSLLNRAPLNAEEMAQLDAHLHLLVDANALITKRVAPLEEATALFESRHEDDKVRLLEQRTRNILTLYTLRGYSDYYYGYMVPSTGYLRTYKLLGVDEGFILQYPRKETPTQLDEIKAYDKIEAVFREADDWLTRLGVEDIGRLNQLVREDRAQELILVAEALHEQRVAQIAGEIVRRHESQGVRVVLIAGPSSSGKTTFSKRLAIQLLAHGLRPFTLEMDNYFLDRELTPKDPTGAYDFEALGAINLPLFNQHLLQLIGGQEVHLPHFNFVTGRSENGQVAQLTEHQILILEGIHGLNPKLVPHIPREKIYRIYVSALTQLNLDRHNRVSTTDVRLLRRIVRDARTRGYDAEDTLGRWSSVRRGEKRNIFAYQENADIMLNSALVYELAALRPWVEPLLLQVEPGTRAHIEANRLLSFIRWVQPLSPKLLSLIPDTSLLREFIGDSILENYHPTQLTRGDS
jgi:uridine kinase